MNCHAYEPLPRLLGQAALVPVWNTDGKATIAKRIQQRKRPKRPSSNADTWIPYDPAVFEPLGVEYVEEEQE